jgi:hypothetical protein
MWFIILDACVSFKLLSSSNWVTSYFLYNFVWRYAELGNELIISYGKQKVCGDQGIDA